MPPGANADERGYMRSRHATTAAVAVRCNLAMAEDDNARMRGCADEHTYDYCKVYVRMKKPFWIILGEPQRASIAVQLLGGRCDFLNGRRSWIPADEYSRPIITPVHIVDLNGRPHSGP